MGNENTTDEREQKTGKHYQELERILGGTSLSDIKIGSVGGDFDENGRPLRQMTHEEFDRLYK